MAKASSLEVYVALDPPGVENLNYEGSVIITIPGQPEAQIPDWLLDTIGSIFEAIPKLASGARVTIPYFQHSGEVIFQPKGGDIILSGDFVPELTLPRRDLIAALFACGEEFIGLLRSLPRTDEVHIRNIETLVAPAMQAAPFVDRGALRGT